MYAFSETLTQVAEPEEPDFIKSKPEYIYLVTLKKRAGWTDKVIQQFLPDADLYRPNPHNRKLPPSSLYRLDRVNTVEASAEWQAASVGANKRKEAALRAAAVKRRKLLDYVANLEILVPVIEHQKLINKSCGHYNKRRADRCRWGDYVDGPPATLQSEPVFLKRITLNYLRHCLTCYENELAVIFGKVGVGEAYLVLKERINEAICEQYPFLR